jgi:hypothetical protein
MPKLRLIISGNLETPESYGASSDRQKLFSFDVPLKDVPNNAAVKVRVELFYPRSRIDESCLPSPFDEKNRLLAIELAEYEFRYVSLRSVCEAEVSEDLLNALRDGATTEEKLITIELKNELKSFYYGMENATNETLLLIKYGLYFSSIKEPPFSGSNLLYWSVDGSEWKHIGLTKIVYGCWDSDQITLDKGAETQIQQYIDSNFSHFFALASLHKAKNERDPRYKIIYAAHAAELAIKEFLIEYARKKGYPLESLVLELPSPPLGVLYGNVLKDHTGRGSPKTDDLIKLNSARNEMMHRPPQKEKKIDLAQAEKHVRDVEAAIFHLLNMLYENDPLLKRLCNKYNKKRSCRSAKI